MCKKFISVVMSILMIMSVFAGIEITSVAEDDILNYLTYEINDGEVTITGCDTSISGDITIPDTIEGYPLTEIDGMAFIDCNRLTSVIIPNSVTRIGGYAFYYCSNLTNITIPDSVTTIDEQAFYGTEYYNNELNWENGILYINNFLINAKAEITGNYEIKRGTTIIVDKAFEGCDSLTNVIIPDSVITIGNQAFYNCNNLENVTIGNSVTSIGEEALKNCKKIIVDENNSVYSSDEHGVLFNKDKTELVCFPKYNSLTEYEIPDTVITIGSDAFSGCSNLLDITIPDSVTTLKSYSFAGCGITELELPYSVKKLERYVFGNTYTNISTVTINYPYCDIAEQGTGMDPSIPYETTLIGYSGSSAEKYADIYGYTFIPLEDEFSTEAPTVSGDDILEHITYEIKDGKVTIMDFDAYIGGDVVIPDTIEGFPVTTIYHFAFSSCYWITSVKLPDSLTNLMPSAFPHCHNLEKITMGTGIKSIPWVFSECKKLSTVYYKGTADQWAEISIIDDYYLSNANIIYNWQEPLPEEPTTEDPTTKEPETEVPTTEPTTKEPETEVPTTEPTTKEPETEPTTKEPETQAPTTEKPTEKPSTDGPATDGPTEKPTETTTQTPVSDKLEVKDDTIKVDNASKISTVKTKSSADDIIKSVKNKNVSIIDKNGKAISDDTLVGTGAKIQIKDNSGKVINTYTVCVPNDVDGNGKTTAADARLALRGSARLEKIEGVYARASDVTGDGKITAADARKILRISAGLEKY